MLTGNSKILPHRKHIVFFFHSCADLLLELLMFRYMEEIEGYEGIEESLNAQAERYRELLKKSQNQSN